MSEIPEEISELFKADNFNPSQVQVVENGQNVMRPDVMQFLMTAAIASQAVKVRKYFDDRTSEGWTQNFILAVTPVVQRVELERPAQSFYIINDGPGQIFVSINYAGRTGTPLLIGEDLPLDFETHKLRRFYVWSAPAVVAAARAAVKG